MKGKKPEGKGGNVDVRAAVASDLPAVSQLWEESSREFEQAQRLFGRKPDALNIFRASLETWLDEPHHMLAVAELAGRVVGFIHAHIAGRSPIAAPAEMGRVEDFHVSRELADKARGEAHSKLLSEAVSWLAMLKTELVELHVPTHQNKQNFEHLGFSTVYYRMRANVSDLAGKVFMLGAYDVPVVYPGTDDFQPRPHAAPETGAPLPK